MNTKSWLTVASVVLTSAVTVSAGDITGKINLKGTPPPERALPLDPACGASFKKNNPGGKPTTRFFASKDGGLGDVFISVKGVKGKGKAPSGDLAIDQRGCEYLPYVSACQTGQTITVKNSDPVLHNIHPTPRVAGNPEKNLAQLPNGPVLKFSYKNAEEFLRFKCDVHPWMFAYVNVVDHSYFAVSAEDGSYTIKDVPDGTYTVVAKHRKADPVENKVTVKGGKVTADFTVVIK